MNVNKARRYLSDVQDKAGKYGLEHADGSPCDAKTPETCPHNKKAQKADDLSGFEGANGGVEVSTGNKKGSDIEKASDDLHDFEYEAMDEELQDIASLFEGKACRMRVSYDGGAAFSADVSFECKCLEEYDGIKKDENGKWVEATSISPLFPEENVEKDENAFNEYMSKYGLGMKGKLMFDEDDDIHEFHREGSDLIAEYKVSPYTSDLIVTDAEKFQEFKNSFKEGGSRRTPYLDDRIREDKEWKASPEYQEHLADLKKKFPTMNWD